MVRANIGKLISHQIDFGAIAVLARDTLPSIKQIYRFFDELGIDHRILPYYRSVSSDQARRHGLDFDELVGAYKDVFHEWLASERATPVDPIKDYVRYAIRHVTGVDNDRYDRSISERVFIIDINGDVFNSIESYEPEFRYGNLFSSAFHGDHITFYWLPHYGRRDGLSREAKIGVHWFSVRFGRSG